MKKACPECGKTLKKDKLQIALDCTYLVCKNCNKKYIYYHRTMELIKIEPKVKL